MAVGGVRGGSTRRHRSFPPQALAGVVVGENNRTGAFLRAATQPLPHQAFLLDKLLSGNRFGHVLADDVGLGKTVEAGLIIMSLLQQEAEARVLVVFQPVDAAMAG